MWMALDTETTGLDLLHGCRPFSVQMAFDDDRTRDWIWRVNPKNRAVSIPPRDILEIREDLAACDLVFHNIKFDVRALEMAGIIEWKRSGKLPGAKLKGITAPEILERADDTLTANHIINSGESHRLKDLSVKYLDILPDDEEALESSVKEAKKYARKNGWDLARSNHPHWPALKLKSGAEAKDSKGGEDKSGWKFDCWVPREVAFAQKLPKDHPWWTVVRRYGVRDVIRTLGLWLLGTLPSWKCSGFMEYLQEHGLWEQYLLRKKQHLQAYRMERHGLPTDPKLLRQAETDFHDQRLIHDSRMRDVVRRIKNPSVDPDEFNIGSPKQLSAVLFKDLGLTPVSEGKTGPSTKAPDLDSILSDIRPETDQHIFLSSLIGWRKSGKMLEYLGGYEAGALEENGMLMIRPELNPTRTKTTRWGGERPNPQNVSKKDRPEYVYRKKGRWSKELIWTKVERDSVITASDLAYNLRTVFTPPKGWILYDMDYDNGELRLFSYDAGDKDLIQTFKTGGSLHLVIARRLWADKLPKEDGAAKKTDMYRWTKNGNFALLYGASKKKADATYHIDGGYDLLRGEFPLIDEFIERMHSRVAASGYIETLGGRLAYPLRVSRKEPHKASNYRIQGSLGWIMALAMSYCDDYLRGINGGRQVGEIWKGIDWNEPNGRMLLQVHDSLIFAFPEDGPHEEHARKCAKLMEKAASDILDLSGMDMDFLPNPPIPVSIEQIKPGMTWASGKSLV